MSLYRCAVATILALFCLVTSVSARTPLTSKSDPDGGIKSIFVLDGSPVHNVGELRLHMSNWGMFGSWPGSGFSFSSAPSGEWPAGSGIEHVFAGGLWVAAIKSGVPAVSQAAFQFEFRPTQSPADIVYYSAHGAPGGTRYPFAGADDDQDGTTDEEFLDGHDNDQDGQIDEDYAAISDQMMSRWYTDDQPEATQIYPQHNPLGITVRETSYQWEHDDYDDFVGIDYEITNTGATLLEQVYIGIFLDGDVGDRDTPNYWENDIFAFRRLTSCTEVGALKLDYGYVGDELIGSGLGVLLLDHPTYPDGEWAPERVHWSTFAGFSGTAAYEDGGDPTNDFERYELMSSETIERDGVVPRDNRILLSAGPFEELAPGATIKFSVALVAFPLADQSNVLRAAVAYHGRWLDGDANPNTGVEGRETRVIGPAFVAIDECRTGYELPVVVPRGQELWINWDCEQEEENQSLCGYENPEQYATGVNGKEYHLHWILPDENTTPVAIQRFDARATGSGVSLEWELWADEAIERLELLRGKPSGPMTIAATLNADAREFVDVGVEPGTRYEYQLVVHELDGGTIMSQRAGVSVPGLEFVLRSISPNPFTTHTTVSFSLPAQRSVVLSVYDVSGRRVASVFSGEKSAGDHTLNWNGVGDDGNTVSAGIYFVRLDAGKETLTRKILMVR